MTQSIYENSYYSRAAQIANTPEEIAKYKNRITHNRLYRPAIMNYLDYQSKDNRDRLLMIYWNEVNDPVHPRGATLLAPIHPDYRPPSL